VSLSSRICLPDRLQHINCWLSKGENEVGLRRGRMTLTCGRAPSPQVHNCWLLSAIFPHDSKLVVAAFCFLRLFVVLGTGTWPHSMSLTRPKVCLFLRLAPKTLAISHNWLKIMKCYGGPIAVSSLRWHLHFIRSLLNSSELSPAACTWRKFCQILIIR